MSFFIMNKDMTVPRCCAECDFVVWSKSHRTAWCSINNYKQCFEDCSTEYNSERSKDCPIIGIPYHHGRLIDADDLKKGLCAECTYYPDKCLGEDCDWDSIFHINHSKTIIEAE